MFRTFISLITATSLLSASCLTGYDKSAAMTVWNNLDGKEVPTTIFCPTRDASNEGCNSISFKSIEDGEPYCIYYELPIKETTSFKQKSMEMKYFNSLPTAIEMDKHNNKTGVEIENRNEFINKELIKAQTPDSKSSFAQYLPGFFEEEFKKDFLAKIKSPGSIEPKFKTQVTKNDGMCGRCQDVKMPSIGINNILKQIQDEIAGLENEVQEMATSVIDELATSIYDLTSDEAVIYYYIMAISYATASLTCAYKTYVVDPTDVLSLSKAATTAVTTASTTAKNNIDSEAVQAESKTNQNCGFSFNNNCVFFLPGNSGIEKGGRNKELEQGKASSTTETVASSNVANTTYFNTCMEKEPALIREKLTKFLQNTVNGVEIDLFAIKQCNDDYAEKQWKAGLTSDNNKNESDKELMLEKILNFAVSYVDTKRHAAAGYLDAKQEALSNLLNGNKNKDKELLKKFEDKLVEVKDSRTKKDYIKDRLIEKFLRKTTYSVALQQAFLKEIESIELTYKQYNDLELRITDAVNTIKDTVDLTESDSELVNYYAFEALKDSVKNTDRLLEKMSLNKEDKFYRGIGCIEYNGTDCSSVGVRLKLFSNLDTAFQEYKRVNFDSKYPLFKNQNLDSIRDYIFESVFDNGNISNLKSVDHLKVYFDYLALKNYSQVVSALKLLELNVGKNGINLQEKERDTFIKESKELLRMASNEV